MSRVGKNPIAIPSDVVVDVGADSIKVTGPKGNLEQFRVEGIDVIVVDGEVIVARKNDDAMYRAKHGLMRSLIQNMVIGVSEGFQKQLLVTGVGFKVAQAGNGLKLNLGFSHDINYTLPEGVMAKVEQNSIIISGISKQQVGQVAAEIRAFKKPEPYKGKGITYSDERILRKSGKSGKEA